MKYRVLTSEELSHFDEDFKHFLIVNGIHAEAWLQLNSDEPQKALQLIELFSDTILQKVYEKISFLEFRSPDSCMVFQIKSGVIDLITIQKKENTTVDLSSPESIHDALINNSDKLTFFKSSKVHTGMREQEIHRMIEQGCVISTAEFWNSLSEAVQ
jgi:hypothetical protein